MTIARRSCSLCGSPAHPRSLCPHYDGTRTAGEKLQPKQLTEAERLQAGFEMIDQADLTNDDEEI